MTHRKKPLSPETLQERGWLMPGDKIVSTGDRTAVKIIRDLSDDLSRQLEGATLDLIAAPLYMHYWSESAVENHADPSWQNQAVFFWRAEEPFPRKSLPQSFETYEQKYFIFIGYDERIKLHQGEVIPWFGMPGEGIKFYCSKEDKQITISELHDKQLIVYVQQMELTEENVLELLTDTDRTLLLVDERFVRFANNLFMLGENVIPLNLAYKIGGVHIVKRLK